MTTVIFSHGQESGPWGTKIRAMAECVKNLGCEVDSIDYQGIADPTARVAKLIKECGDIDDRLILAGSSMGGHVATAAAEELGAAPDDSRRLRDVFEHLEAGHHVVLAGAGGDQVPGAKVLSIRVV